VSQEEKLGAEQGEKPAILLVRREERLGVEQEGTLASPCESPEHLLEEKREAKLELPKEERLEAGRVVTQAGLCERREHRLVARLGAGPAACL